MALESQNRWNRENTRNLTLKLNNKTDADIIEVLETKSSKAAYIKQLIRADIAKNQGEQE